MTYLLQNFIKNAISNDVQVDQSIWREIPPNLYCFNISGQIVDCNELEVKTFGFSNQNELLGLTVYEIAAEKTAALYHANNQEVIATRKAKISIEPVYLSNCEKINYLTYKVPLRNFSKKIIGVIGLSLPVSHNKMTDNHLKNNTNLTLKQHNCLYYLTKGMTIKEIARKLDVSPRTIEHRLEAIKFKLNCYSRSDLITKALELFFVKY